LSTIGLAGKNMLRSISQKKFVYLNLKDVELSRPAVSNWLYFMSLVHE